MAKLEEENKTVLTNEKSHTTFTKTNRFSKKTAIKREFEITVMHNYLPGYIVDEPSVVGDDFYGGKVFENTLTKSKVLQLKKSRKIFN